MALFAALAAGCGDSSGSGGSGAGGESSTGGSGTGGATPSDCEAGKLCMVVAPSGDPAPGRLAIVWFRFEDDIGHDPTIAFEQPFDTAATRIDVALSQISTPPDKDRICDRDCQDLPLCQCTSEFQAAIAYVLVVVDANGNGAVDIAEVGDPKNYVGISNAAIVFSATTEPNPPAPYDATFPKGVTEGIAPYRFTGAAYEPGEAGEVFSLKAGTTAF